MSPAPCAFVGAFAGAALSVRCTSALEPARVSARPAQSTRMTVAAEADTEIAQRAANAAATVAGKNKENLSKFDRMRLKFGLPVAQEKSGFGYEDFANAMSDFDYNFKDGDKCVGRVYQFEPNGALVDIGAKASAYCPVFEMSMTKLERPEDGLDIGEDREFMIISNEDQNGQLRVSIRRIEFSLAWERVTQLQAEDATIFAEVVQVNRGGCLVLVEGLRAFLPGSHMSLRTPREDLVGVELPLKFLEVDAPKNRLVVSHRRAMVEKQMSAIEAGQVVQGVVRGVKPYGAFIDLNGVSGLLHISQISHDHVHDIGAVLKEGMDLKVMVLASDKDKGRISLSTKTLEPEPGDFIRDPQLVFDSAEEMCARHHARLEEERKAAADVADDIVSTLDMASLDDLAIDPIDAPVPSSRE
jgi:small subunit ribosomal protein S1